MRLGVISHARRCLSVTPSQPHAWPPAKGRFMRRMRRKEITRSPGFYKRNPSLPWKYALPSVRPFSALPGLSTCAHRPEEHTAGRASSPGRRMPTRRWLRALVSRVRGVWCGRKRHSPPRRSRGETDSWTDVMCGLRGDWEGETVIVLPRPAAKHRPRGVWGDRREQCVQDGETPIEDTSARPLPD